MRNALAVLALVACGGNETPPADLLDTGWFVDTASFDPETCAHKLVASVPADGVQDWYWRSRPTISVGSDKHERYTVSLVDAAGQQVATTLVWDDTGLNAEVAFTGQLAPNTDYTLEVVDCATRHLIAFRTSHFGLPLQGSTELLEGKTWTLELVAADWVEPPGIAGLLQLYFTTPVLFGIDMIDGDLVDFLAAPGTVDLFGQVQQDLTQESWDFPITDFSAAPYFDASSESVVFRFDGYEVPLTDFRFSGTISADMTEIGGGDLAGLGDTRNLGPLLEQDDNPSAVCDLVGGLGVDCQPCPDGEIYCLFMHAVDVHGSLVPNLTLQPR